MEDSLKELFQELGNAINDSLSESDRIAEAIDAIKQSGYDVFLVLEATIGFNKHGDSESGEGEKASTEIKITASDGQTEQDKTVEPNAPHKKFRFTAQDKRFLSALKITADDEPKPGGRKDEPR